MTAELLRLVDALCDPDEQRAFDALGELEAALTPQGIAFEEGSPECIPLMLELALGERTVIQADLLEYLGRVFHTAGVHRRLRAETSPEYRSGYDAGVVREESVAAGYEEVLPRVLALVQRDGDVGLRGAGVLLLGGAFGHAQTLVPVLRQLYDRVAEEPLKIDVIEAVASLGIGPHTGRELRSSVGEWLAARMAREEPAGIRLGAALGQLARVGPEEHEFLREVIVVLADSVHQGTSALESAVWMKGPVRWAIRRRIVR